MQYNPDQKNLKIGMICLKRGEKSILSEIAIRMIAVFLQIIAQ